MLTAFVFSRLQAVTSLASKFFAGLYYYKPPEIEEEVAAIEKVRKRQLKAKRTPYVPPRTITLAKVPVSLSTLCEFPMYDDLELLLRVSLAFSIAIAIGTAMGYWTKQGKYLYDFTFTVILFILLWIGRTLVKIVKSSQFELKMALLVAFVTGIFNFFAISVAPEEMFEFDLHVAYIELEQSLSRYSAFTGIYLSKTLFLLAVSSLSGLLTGLCAIPGIRFAKCHHTLQSYSSNRARWLTLLLVSLPVVIALSFWTGPRTAVLNIINEQVNSAEVARKVGETIRFLLLVVYLLFRVLPVSNYLQSFLDGAQEEARSYVRITNPTSQITVKTCRKIWFIYVYICVVAIELLLPTLFVFFSAIGLWLVSTHYPFLGADVVVTSLGASALHHIFSYLVWWVCMVQTVSCSGALVYTQMTCTDPCCTASVA